MPHGGQTASAPAPFERSFRQERPDPHIRCNPSPRWARQRGILKLLIKKKFTYSLFLQNFMHVKEVFWVYWWLKQETHTFDLFSLSSDFLLEYWLIITHPKGVLNA